MEKVLMIAQSTEAYRASNGQTLRREHGETPNGNPLSGRWVLRDTKGAMIDFDQYRHDLAARYSLSLIELTGEAHWVTVDKDVFNETVSKTNASSPDVTIPDRFAFYFADNGSGDPVARYDSVHSLYEILVP